MPRGRRPANSAKPRATSRTSPAMSPEARENQLIALAYDLAEQRMRDGTASAQEVTHFLKMGSTKERLEREIMAEQKKLVTAKTGAYDAQQHSDEIYMKAIKAFQSYSGGGEIYEDD